MATLYWLGVDGDWTNTANWGTARHGAGGSGPPIDGDTVLILDGDVAITQNINQTGIDLAACTIGGKFLGGIGNGGTSLVIGCAGIFAINLSPGHAALIHLTAGDDNIDDLRVTNTGRSQLILTSGTFTSADFSAGTDVLINAPAVVATYRGMGNARAFPGTAFTTASQFGGQLTSERGAGTLNVQQARSVFSDSAAISTALYVYQGGRHEHDSTGTITLGQCAPGGVAVAVAHPFTVTNGNQYQGGTLFENNPSLVTKTNPTRYIGTR